MVYIKNGFAPLQTACRSPPSFLPSPFGLPFQPNPIAVLSYRVCPFTPQPSQAIWLLIPHARMWKSCLVAACAQDRTLKPNIQCLLHLTKLSGDVLLVGMTAFLPFEWQYNRV